jgi:hypothetical protein
MNKAVWYGMGVFLAASSSLASAAGEVKLQEVTSIVSSKYGQSQQGTTIQATIKNLAFSKQVFAHYQRVDGTWTDLPLAYVRATGDGKEVWSTSLGLPLNTTQDVQFALKYVVNGQTYWDNNNGANYFVPKDSGATLGAGVNVYAHSYQPAIRLGVSDQYVHGAVVLKNLAVQKDVTVQYSTDNWATTRTAVATFALNPWTGAYSSAQNPNAAGFEVWNYTLNVGGANEVAYAIRYVVNGETHWDNNFGQNYRTNIERQ